MKIRFPYWVWTLVLFLTEVGIALWVEDAFVRPYVGDYLVVIFLYTLCQTFKRWPVWPLSAGVLVFAYLIEGLQYAGLIYRLGWENSRMAHLILGSSFSWEDMLAYTLGIATVLLMEKRWGALSGGKMAQG
ncbi:MAG: DUF2809 domain-containing protein [Bacteroidota bacterium]